MINFLVENGSESYTPWTLWLELKELRYCGKRSCQVRWVVNLVRRRRSSNIDINWKRLNISLLRSFLTMSALCADHRLDSNISTVKCILYRLELLVSCHLETVSLLLRSQKYYVCQKVPTANVLFSLCM